MAMMSIFNNLLILCQFLVKIIKLQLYYRKMKKIIVLCRFLGKMLHSKLRALYLHVVDKSLDLPSGGPKFNSTTLHK